MTYHLTMFLELNNKVGVIFGSMQLDENINNSLDPGREKC